MITEDDEDVTEDEDKGTSRNISPLDGSFEEETEETQENKNEKGKETNPSMPHKRSEIKCDVCNKKVHKRSLSRHLRTHGEKYQCSLCPATFCEKFYLDDHESMHTNPLVCETCGKHFTSRSGFNSHKRYHDGGRDIVCDICQQHFRSKAHYEGYRNSQHLDYKPFICSICNKGFAYKQNMKRHMLECSGQTNFACHTCRAPFKTRRALREHLQGKHGDNKYTCECGKSYTWKRCYNRHIKLCKSN